MPKQSLEDQVNGLVAKALADNKQVNVMKRCAEGVYLVAYESRNPSMVFVPDPCRRGRFCRVPRGFLYRPCPACGALAGQPCHNPKHGTSWSGSSGHGDRQSNHGRNYQRFSHATQDDDRLKEAALVALATMVKSLGVEVSVTHYRNCPAYREKNKRGVLAKRICNCGHEERSNMLSKIIRQLPKLENV